MKKILLLLTILAMIPGVASAETVGQVTADVSSYDPAPAEPGEPVEIWVNLHNTGNQGVHDFEARFVDNQPFTLVREDQRVTEINRIDGGGDYTIRYNAVVDDNAIDGASSIILELTSDQARHTKTTAIPLDIRRSDTEVTVSNVESSPDQVRPGDNFTVNMDVENNAPNGIVRDINVRLNLENVRVEGETGTIQKPFSPLGTTNEKSINALSSGQNQELQFPLISYPDAQAGLYKIPVELEYTNRDGERVSREVTITTQVNAEPDFMVNIDSSDLTASLEEGEVSFEIVNRGLANSKFVTVSLDDGNGYNVTSSSHDRYIGELERDDFDTVRYTIDPSTNDVSYDVTLTYRNAFNQERQETFTLNESLRSADDGGMSIWIIAIVALFIIGAIFYWRRRK